MLTRVNVLDILIVVAFFGALALGIWRGFIWQFFATLGLIVGCLVAAYTQVLISGISLDSVGTDNPLFFWLIFALAIFIVLLITNFGITAGEAISHRFKFKRRPALSLINKIGGSLLGGASILLLAWTVGLLFMRSPSVVANQVNQSTIVITLKRIVPVAPPVLVQASNLLNPHSSPLPFIDYEPVIGAQIPNTQPNQDLVDAADEDSLSVVEVGSRGCGGLSTATGFVVSDNLVVTNAHVIAGTLPPNIYIADANGHHQAKPLVFDPDLDIAILQAAGLAGKPLKLSTSLARQGSAAVVLGFATGSLKATVSTIAGSQAASGFDIYNQKMVSRSIYAIHGIIEHGDSGGPVINSAGEAIGVVFAKSSNLAGIGYALTADQLLQPIEQAKQATSTAKTGSCGIKT